MESKLEEYRLRKRRKQKYEEIKGFLRKMFSYGSASSNDKEHIIEVHDTQEDVQESKEEKLPDIISSSEDEISEKPVSNEENKNVPVDTHKEYINYTLKTFYFLFWATCYVIAIELQFGIVFLMFSALLGIYFNTRTGPKPRHEISAYSVFNKDCESIDGTLKAEQFEREIRYGSNSVR